jgi:hypothetical protein
MSKKDLFVLKLSDHGYTRMNQRITEMTFPEAENFAKEEINKSRISQAIMQYNGREAIAYIYQDIKYIVRNNVIVTVYTLY